MLKQTIATQQSEAVCILAQGGLIGDDPPEIRLGHTVAVEGDRTDCSDCDRKKGVRFKYHRDVECLNYIHYHIHFYFQ